MEPVSKANTPITCLGHGRRTDEAMERAYVPVSRFATVSMSPGRKASFILRSIFPRSPLATLDTRKIGDALQHSPSTLPEVSKQLLQDGNRAEYAIAILSDECFAQFVATTEKDFPKTAREFLDSTTSSMLSRVSSTVVEMVMIEDVYLRMAVSTRRLREERDTVTLAQPALIEIARLSSAMVLVSSDIPVKPFADLNMDVPTTRSEMSVAERNILRSQLRIFKFFLEVLRDPEAVQFLGRRQSLHDPELEPQDAGSQATIDRVVGTNHPDPGTPGPQAEQEADHPDDIYEGIAPRAALYTENVKGFGEWKINVTDNANSQLRKLRKRSPETLRLVMTKIKDLSRGHFSSDNHILISDTENAVPIFKANVSGDTRLIYLVDCVVDSETGLEHQALRIFGVYNHAELGRMGNFWDALGRDLGRQGKAYRDCCRARSHPRNVRGDDIFTPCTFSNSGHQGETSKPRTLVENLEELDYSMILSMHRFVGFSKALLNSLIADRDIEFMFNPSSMERRIIEHPNSCYVIGRSGTGKTLTMMYKIISIERGWLSEPWGLSKPRQLFVTRSRMLAGEVQRTTDELMESFRLAELSQEELVGLRNGQGDEGHRRPLPKKWSQLEEDHFPLFIEFDKLRGLLEADFVESIRLLSPPVDDADGSGRDDDETGLVSGRRFIKAYWDHLPQSLTKGLDPASVFAEIMGVIQGSEGTIDTPRGYLNRESYLKLSTRSQPTFASMRDRVYDIFERYVSLKRRRREHDDAERTHRLLAVLATQKLPGHPVQFLYNDEAQDNLIVDMLLLRSLCNNPNGLFWAGDTAQTITLGSSFKFSELTSMMYRIEILRGVKQSYIAPSTFHLAVNYRSHSGITDCARTIVELLTDLWPDTIDKLSGDSGWREGPPPVFIKGSADLSRLFGQKDRVGGPLELGAEQCIIVHDEASREALFSQGVLGGLILTVFQSKGLEFNDVFLWNFFVNSESDGREWDAVCGLFNDPTRPRDSIDKYRNVCRELKSLYVAITRARTNLFIIEEFSHRNPVLDLWKTRRQVEVQDGLTYSFKLSNLESLPEDWARRGRALMDKQQYEQAKYCFDKAGLPLESGVAQAYLQQEAAVTAEEFEDTAQRFQSCAELSLDRVTSTELLLASAVCYSRGGNLPRSAQLYHDAFEYTKCVRQYCKASMMEKALDVTRGHREDIDGLVVKDVCTHFLDKREYERVADLFPDPDECIQFMQSHALTDHLATYLESLERFGEAAEVHLTLDHTTKAITLFLRDRNPNSVARGTQILLDELWRRRTLGRSSKLSSKLVELLSDRQALPSVRYQGCDRHEDEMRMFSFIISREPGELLRLGMRLSSNSHTSDPALLSLDYAFTFLLDADLEPSTLVDSSTFFPAFCVYAAILKAHCRDPRPSKALGVRAGKLGSYNILEESVLHGPALGLLKLGREVRGGVILTASSTSRLLRDTLGERLRSRVSIVNEACKKVPILQPCISYCLARKCAGGANVNNQCRGTHRGGPHPLDTEGIHLRIRLLCQMIIAYDTVDPSGRGDAVWKERNFWMSSLSSSIHVPFFALGTPLMFHFERVPEFLEARRVLNGWITDILYIPFARSSAHWIPSVDGRTALIPRAALLGYMLDGLRDALRAASNSVPLNSWYGPSYVRHLQALRTFQVNAPSCANMPGALVYLQFLLRQRGEGREVILAHLAEGLSTAFVVAKPGPNDRTLHNVILSRGWLVNLVDLWNSQRDSPSHSQGHIDDFVDLFGPILRTLCATRPKGAGVQSLQWESVLSNVSRMAKAFFLVGHWLKHPEEEESVHRAPIVSLIANIPEGYRPPYLQELFVERAEGQSDWDTLEEAIWGSNTFSSTSAEQLMHVQKRMLRDARPMPTPGSVVPVVYNMLDTLPPLLSVSQPPRQPEPFPSEWFPHPVVVARKEFVPPEAAPCFPGQLRPVAI